MQPKRSHGYSQEELERMCSGKHRWPDEICARAGAMQSLERRPLTKRLFTYRCPACKGWHLTRCKQKNQEPVKAPGEES